MLVVSQSSKHKFPSKCKRAGSNSLATQSVRVSEQESQSGGEMEEGRELQQKPPALLVPVWNSQWLQWSMVLGNDGENFWELVASETWMLA